MTILLWLAAAALILIGLAGTILPALPGAVFVFAGIALGAWIDDFTRVPVWLVVVCAVLTVIAWAVDYFAAVAGAKRAGASRLAIVGAMIGTLGGLVFGPFGLLVGPFAGALAGELLHRRSLQREHLGHAARVGFGTWFGIALGTALKLALAFAMLGLFALAWWL